jgi:hypothetical protein
MLATSDKTCPHRALQDAIQRDPRNPLARFERAAALAATGRDAEALAELTALQVWGEGGFGCGRGEGEEGRLRRGCDS